MGLNGVGPVVQSVTCWTYWEIKGVSISYHLYVVWDVKNKTLSLKWRTNFCLSHQYHHPSLHMDINELKRNVEQDKWWWWVTNTSFLLKYLWGISRLTGSSLATWPCYHLWKHLKLKTMLFCRARKCQDSVRMSLLVLFHSDWWDYVFSKQSASRLFLDTCCDNIRLPN